jgi:hypothetical protein
MNGHSQCAPACLKRAIRVNSRRSKQRRYSMISSARANMGHGEAEELRGLQVDHKRELGHLKNHRLSKRSACRRSANIAFNGLPDQIRRPLS